LILSVQKYNFLLEWQLISRIFFTAYNKTLKFNNLHQNYIAFLWLWVQVIRKDFTSRVVIHFYSKHLFGVNTKISKRARHQRLETAV